MLKRLLDIIGSAAGIILLSPLLVLIYGTVRLRLGSHALFTQQRPGRNGKVFTFYKYRTMTDKRDSNGELLPDKDRPR